MKDWPIHHEPTLEELEGAWRGEQLRREMYRVMPREKWLEMTDRLKFLYCITAPTPTAKSTPPAERSTISGSVYVAGLNEPV